MIVLQSTAKFEFIPGAIEKIWSITLFIFVIILASPAGTFLGYCTNNGDFGFPAIQKVEVFLLYVPGFQLFQTVISWVFKPEGKYNQNRSLRARVSGTFLPDGVYHRTGLLPC